MQGYIHHSRKAEQTGSITCCSGSCTKTFWSFSFDDCSGALQTTLESKDVTGVPKDTCSPIPSDGIKVRFDSKISGSVTVATNITAM
jgi:hypothetical protein